MSGQTLSGNVYPAASIGAISVEVISVSAVASRDIALIREIAPQVVRQRRRRASRRGPVLYPA